MQDSDFDQYQLRVKSEFIGVSWTLLFDEEMQFDPRESRCVCSGWARRRSGALVAAQSAMHSDLSTRQSEALATEIIDGLRLARIDFSTSPPLRA